MATGTTLGPLLTLAMTVVGLAGMVKASRDRRARRNGTAPEAPTDVEAERRKAERAETERRMQAYLAQRSSASRPVDDEMTEQEIRR